MTTSPTPTTPTTRIQTPRRHRGRHGKRRNQHHYNKQHQEQQKQQQKEEDVEMTIMNTTSEELMPAESEITAAELTHLDTIENQVKVVEEKIQTRLVSQYEHLLGFVCGYIWLLRTKRPQDMEDKMKKMRMEVGAFDYSVKEQAEFLTRYLCELDNILSYGNVQVKDKRKALVLYIQKLLPLADQLKKKSLQLKNFNELLLTKLSTKASTTASTTTTISTSMDMEVDDDQVMPSTTAEPLEQPEEEEDDDDEQEEEENHNLLRTLPVWKPYYQIHKRSDGVYLTVNLRGVDPQNIRVQVSTSTGVLKISGCKLPTQKDLLMTRLQGVPTFGRFEIIERLPTHVVNLERATQEILANELLEIRLPFYMVQHPRLFRPHSIFEPRRCVVW